MIAENAPLILRCIGELDRARERQTYGRQDRHHRARYRAGL